MTTAQFLETDLWTLIHSVTETVPLIRRIDAVFSEAISISTNSTDVHNNVIASILAPLVFDSVPQKVSEININCHFRSDFSEIWAYLLSTWRIGRNFFDTKVADVKRNVMAIIPDDLSKQSIKTDGEERSKQ